MQVIRSNMFETNSSSVHTVAVNPREAESVPLLVLGDFGWGPWRSNDPYVKASYLLTLDTYGSELHKTFSDEIRYVENEKKCVANFIKALKKTETYKEITEVFGKEIPIDKDRYHMESIHVDGESLNSSKGFLDKIGMTMKKFILDKCVYLIISNDNCYFSPEKDAAPIRIYNVRGLLR